MPTNPISPLTLVLVLALVTAVLYLGFRLRFELWKRRYLREARRDAVQRSQAVTVGKVYEQLVPFLPDFRWNPKDARFVGAPVDFIVFDGLNDGALRAVVFVEVKTGSSSLNAHERQIRDAVLDGRVEWEPLNLPDVQAR